ncbi:hypothetical protein V8C40DRAFT_259219 [Trichoderma camerunense]
MDTDQQGNEVRQITGQNLNSSIPLHQRDERWLRWPASVLHVIQVKLTPRGRKAGRRTKRERILRQFWEWVIGDIFHLLLIFVPLALASGAQKWSQKSTFSLGILALAGLESVSASSIEQLCLPLSGLREQLCAEAISNVVSTAICIVAVLKNEMALALDFIIGSVLSSILIGTGASILAGGLVMAEQDIQPPAADLVKMVFIAIAPLIFPSVISQKIQADGGDDQRAVRFVSHSGAIFLLILYLSWVFFRRVSHRELFISAEEDEHILKRVRVSTQTLILYSIIAVSSLVATIFVSRFFVSSVGALVPSIGENFLSLIVIPLVFNSSNYFKAMGLARRAKDISVVVYLTFGSALGNLSVTLPLAVIVGWGSHYNLLFNIPIAYLTSLVLSIWAAGFIVLGRRAFYLGGVILVALYMIIALNLYFTVGFNT